MPSLLDRFRAWREKRQYLGDVETMLFLQNARFAIKDLRRKEEMRKLWRKIHKRNGQRHYVV